jgi:UDP-N-acetylmuramoyl-L-alanyl-D-glutamate--2,6-diaminopimelate ligase
MQKQLSLPTIWPVTRHTDYVGPQSTFFAIKGLKEDGIKYIPLALQKGAKTIITYSNALIPTDIMEKINQAHAQLIFVDEPRRTLALLSAQAWGNPADTLKIIGITGTKGKTTTAWMLFHILKAAGYKTALLSTVQNKINDVAFTTDLTTQHPDYLHTFFNTCIKAGVTHVIMEVAAQSTSLHRTAGLSFDGIIFTNFANSHGEFYENENDYFEAKYTLFSQCKNNSIKLINADDEKGLWLKQKLPEALTYGLINQGTTYYGLNPSNSMQGLSLNLMYKNSLVELVCPSLIGLFNGYNMLAAAAMAIELEIPISIIQHAFNTFKSVPGRLEKYLLPNDALCFIDHAHNPFSFNALLPLLKSMTKDLIVVSGAGGDRDRAMRPELGKIMATYADTIILTTDNPRSEDPAHIMQDILLGIPLEKKSKVFCETDREQAIKIAYSLSKPSSIIALLGKGPEQYQIIGPNKIPFSEKVIIQQL